jgi:hypothetical protein
LKSNEKVPLELDVDRVTLVCGNFNGSVLPRVADEASGVMGGWHSKLLRRNICTLLLLELAYKRMLLGLTFSKFSSFFTNLPSPTTPVLLRPLSPLLTPTFWQAWLSTVSKETTIHQCRYTVPLAVGCFKQIRPFLHKDKVNASQRNRF